MHIVGGILEIRSAAKNLPTRNLHRRSTSRLKMASLPFELTLVLAATRDMGIGLGGTLPWTGLKNEMAYFARVTKRLPPSVSLTPNHCPLFVSI